MALAPTASRSSSGSSSGFNPTRNTPPTVYTSADASAPVLTGAVGSLVALLDACLVNGYGAKGSAGWAKAFTGANLATYRPPAGNRFYLDVNDAAGETGGAKEAIAQGLVTASGVGAGTNPFPTFGQSPGATLTGFAVRKSVTADATARAWKLVADDRTLHLFIASGDTAGRYSSWSWGDVYSFVSGDGYRTANIGRGITNSGAANGSFDATNEPSAATSTAGHALARTAAGTGASVLAARISLGTTIFTAPSPGPNPADSKAYLSRLFLAESVALGWRGYLRGIYSLTTGGTGITDGDTITGADVATVSALGRTFIAVKSTIGGATLAVETTGWDTSA